MNISLISKNRPLWVLTVGFGLVIVMLTLMAWLGLRQATSIRQKAALLVGEHLFTARLVDELELEQQRAGVLLANLLRHPETPAQRAKLAEDLKTFENAMPRLIEEGRRTLPDPGWEQLAQATQSYGAAIRQQLNQEKLSEARVESLEQHYDQLVHLAGNVIKLDSVHAAEIEGRIERESSDLADDLGWLLGGCILMALLCAGLTIQFTYETLRRIEWQAQQLNRVSWHLIEGQEDAARRFSHELHDELGQALAGLKANLVTVTAEDLHRRRLDCLHLLDEAIGNVRELSQLLRPVILDDFGLTAAIRWLTERFQERTRIQVAFHTNFSGRLADDLETHLFRITQEALTNIARHSGATHVEVSLQMLEPDVILVISDDGIGLQPKQKPVPSLGLVGMQARAEQLGGSFHITKAANGGVRVEVAAPARAPQEPAEGDPSA